MKYREIHPSKYFRGTNNREEEQLIKSKSLRPSINHLTGGKEKGISVSDVPIIGKYFKHMNMLSGTEIGQGSDGEPLLDPKTVKFIRWIK